VAVTAHAVCGGCLLDLANCACAPVEEIEGWRVVCDHPGCRAFVRALDCGDDDRTAFEASLALAIAYGWRIAPDRFIRSRRDLCPDHVDAVEDRW